MKNTLILSCLISFTYFLSFTASAQTVYTGDEASRIIPESEMIRSSKNSSLPSYIRLKQNERISFSQLQGWMNKSLDLNSNFNYRIKSIENDQLGFIHYRLQQTHKGIPIETATWIAHTKNNIVHSLNGQLYSNMPSTSSPSVNEETALEHAKSHIGAAIYKWEIPEEETHLKWESNDPEASYFPHGEIVYVSKGFSLKEESFRLAYKFNIYAHAPLSRSFVYVDAITGEILGENAIIHHVDTPGTAETAYSGSQAIIADSFGGSFRLRDASRGLGIRTFDLNNAYGYGGAVDFIDSDNIWDNVNPEQDEYAGDAHWGTEVCYDYFNLEHARNSIDNAGFQLNSYVHYGINYVNAFWDGSRMTYGDGNGAPYTPLTSLDIAGHEITHGLTNFTADLIYFAESGALNESFSDIFGTAIENYGRPGDWDWLLSADIGSSFRSLENPNLFNHPDTYNGTFWAPLAGPDNGGVHTNSGVQNYWYYLLCEGGTGTNDIGDAYDVTGISMTSASAIAFRNLTVYLVDGSDHSDARFFAIQSAIDLFGACSIEEEETTNAWYAVGVGPEYISNVTADFTASIGCFPDGTVDFADISTTATGTIDTWTWDFGDGGTSSLANPSHSFAATGIYTVELTSTNDLGCENITTLDVNVFDAPIVNFSAINLCEGDITSFTDETTLASGIITNWSWSFDDAAATAAIASPTHTFSTSGTYDVKLLATTDNGCTDSVTLPINISPLPTADFTFSDDCFYTTANFVNTSSIGTGTITDYAWDFGDGTPTDVSLSPSHDYITSGVYDVTLAVVSDAGCTNSVTYSTNRFATPTANFSVEDVCLGASASFSDLSTIDAPEILDTRVWDFGDGGTDTGIDPTHDYLASGIYDIKLTTTSANGCSDEITIPIEVNDNPTANFSTTEICVNGGSNIFTDLSSSTDGTINEWSWNFDDGTTSFIAEPTKNFAASGTYNVTLTVSSTNDCENSITLPITVFEKPTANFSSSASSICSPDCIDFIDLSSSPTAGLSSWNWTVENGSTSASQNPNICFDLVIADEVYDVTLIVENTFGCKDTNSIANMISVNATPLADFSFDNTNLDILHSSVDFTNLSQNSHSFIWDFGDEIGTSSSSDPTYTYNGQAGTYEITLEAKSSNGLCSSFAKKLLTINDLILYFIPNTFTPDGDSFNETFKPIFHSGYDPYDFHFVIYNRWGETVFESFDASAGWDGTYGNQDITTDGTYIWQLDFKETMTDRRQTDNGFVTILR